MDLERLTRIELEQKFYRICDKARKLKESLKYRSDIHPNFHAYYILGIDELLSEISKT